MRILLTVSILCAIASCTGQQVSERQRPCDPLSSDEFLDHPFPVDLSMDSVRSYYGDRLRLTRFLRDVGGDNRQKDTIYRFHRGDNSLVFYVTRHGEASFLTAKVGDPSVVLRGCLRVGLSRVRVEELITDFPSDFRDTVSLSNEKRQARFVFDEQKLDAIYINNYFR